MSPVYIRQNRLHYLLIVLGFALLALNGWLMGRLDWRPLEMPLNLAVQTEQSAGFATALDDWYEIQLEVSRNAPAEVIERAIEVARTPSPVDLSWRVESGDGLLAAGDAGGYMYLDTGPHGWPGRLRRTLMRVPTGIDRQFWVSGGLLGHTTVARGVGRFQAEAGASYTLVTQVRDGLSALADGAPRMVVRVARATSQRHYRRIAPIGYAGLAMLGAGLLLWTLALLRR